MQSTMDAVSNADPTGTLSAINASVKLVRAAVKLAPAMKNGYDRFQAHQAGKQSIANGQQTAGLPNNAPGAHAGANADMGVSVAPIDNEQERRAYEKVNMILKTVGERIIKSGLVNEIALARALTQVTHHIEVQLFSIENNKLFQSLGSKLGDPRLVNNVFTSIYLFAFLTSELEKSLPRYNGQISPGLRMVQQLFKVALGLDGFKENLHANLAAYQTLISTASMLKPLDLDFSIFRDFPSFRISRYSSQSRSFSDKMAFKNAYDRLVKYFNERGFPQPLQGRDVGAITNWAFLTGDCNTREFVLEKSDLHIGENFGRVLYFLLCLANRMPDGSAIIAYHDQHVQLVNWFGPRFGYRVIRPQTDLYMVPHLQFMSPKIRAVFDQWLIIMPSQTLLQRRRNANQALNNPAVPMMQNPNAPQPQIPGQRPMSMMPPQTIPSVAPSSIQSPSSDASQLNDPILEHIAAKQKEKRNRMSASGPSNPSVHSDEFASLPDSDIAPSSPPPNYAPNPSGGEPVLGGVNASPVSASPIDSKIQEGHTNVQPVNHRPSIASTEGKVPGDATGFNSEPMSTQNPHQIPGRQNSHNSQSSQTVQYPAANAHHRPSISSVAEFGTGLTSTISGPAELGGSIEEHSQVAPAAHSTTPHAPISTYEQAGPSPANPLYHGPSELNQAEQSTSLPDSPSPATPATPASSVPAPTPYGRLAPAPPRVIRAIAMYDFEPEANDGKELAFRAGDMVEIIEKTKQLDIGGWCNARVSGTWKTALAPISYLHELPNQGPPPVQRPHRTQTSPLPSHGPVAPEQQQLYNNLVTYQQVVPLGGPNSQVNPPTQPHPHVQQSSEPSAKMNSQHNATQSSQQAQQNNQHSAQQVNASGASQADQAQTQSVTVNVTTPSANPAAYPGPNHSTGSARPPHSTISSVSSHAQPSVGSVLASSAAQAANHVIENKVRPRPIGQHAQRPQGAAAEYYGSGAGAGAPINTYNGSISSTAPVPFYNANYASPPQLVATPSNYVPSPLYPGYGPAPQPMQPVNPMYATGPPVAGSYAIPVATGSGGGSLGLNLSHTNQHDDYSSHANSTAINLSGANISLFSNDGNNTSTNQMAVSQSAVVADQEIVAPNQTIVTTPPSDYVVVDNAAASSPLASLVPNTGVSDTYFTNMDTYGDTAVSPLAGLVNTTMVASSSDVDTTVVSGPDGTYYNQTETDTYVATDGMGDTFVEQDTISDSAYVDAQGDTFVEQDTSYNAFVEDDTGDFDF